MVIASKGTKELHMINNAETFVRDVMENNDLRKSLYLYDTSAEVIEAIKELGYHFRLAEFEETIKGMGGAPFDELLMWWKMLMYDGTIKEEPLPAETDCSPRKCSSCSSVCG